MKKSFSLLSLALISLLLLAACSKNNPETVAKDWLTAFYHQDFEYAKKLSTDETKAVLTNIQGFSSALDDSVKKKAKAVNITVKSVKTEGDKATVTFSASNSPDQEEPPLKLVKQNDKWLVQFSKDDFNSGSAQDAPPTGGATITLDAPAQGSGGDSAAMAPDTAKQHPSE